MMRFSRTSFSAALAPWLAVVLALGAAAPAAAAPNEGERSGIDHMQRLLHERGVLRPDVAAMNGLRQASGLASDLASDLVLRAMNFIDHGYRWGGNGEDGFDCSGFTRHIYEKSLGLMLPRRSAEQASTPALQPVEADALRPGDLVFFNTLKRAFSHVGIYVGNGRFIHAPRTGALVRIEDMRGSYWAARFDGARRPQSLAASE